MDLILIFGPKGGKCVWVCGLLARKGRRGLHSKWHMFPFVYVQHFNNFSICTAEGKESTLRTDTMRNSTSLQMRKTWVGKEPQMLQVKSTPAKINLVLGCYILKGINKEHIEIINLTIFNSASLFLLWGYQHRDIFLYLRKTEISAQYSENTEACGSDRTNF